jgi:hypothetical protein
MSKFDGLTYHSVAWLFLWVLYFAVPLIWYPHNVWHGQWGARKHMYSLQAMTEAPSDGLPATRFFHDEVNNAGDYNDLYEHWPSGSKMNMFKNQLGCFGYWRRDIHKTLESHNTTGATHDELDLLTLQKDNGGSEKSVCTCIDQLYFASFQEASTPHQLGYIDPALQTKIQTRLVAAATPSTVKDWMLGNREDRYGHLQHDDHYAGVGFTALMQDAQSSDDYVVCEDQGEKIKKDTHEQMSKAQCMMRRDVEIIGVCTRSAQSVMQIHAQGVVNTAHVKAYAVLSLFLYMFVSLCRYAHDEAGKKSYLVMALTAIICFTAVLLCFYWVCINIDGWWAYAPPWSIANIAVFFLTTLDSVVALVACVAAVAGLIQSDTHAQATTTLQKWTNKVGPVFTANPQNTTQLVFMQILVDVNCITGFSLLLFSLLLEAAVTEVYSLTIVLLMVVTVAFVQHLSNILRFVQKMVLNNLNRVNISTSVSKDQFRLLNECASCRLYLALVVTFICVYLLISPRESQVYPGMNVYTLAVLALFLTCNGFDMVREMEAHVTKTMWLSEHDSDNTRSWVLMVLVVALIVQGGAQNFAHTAIEASSSPGVHVHTYR